MFTFKKTTSKVTLKISYKTLSNQFHIPIKFLLKYITFLLNQILHFLFSFSPNQFSTLSTSNQCFTKVLCFEIQNEPVQLFVERVKILFLHSIIIINKNNVRNILKYEDYDMLSAPFNCTYGS